VVYVDGVGSVPPVLGSTRQEGGETVFQPRYPFQPGVRYRVVFGGTTTIIEVPAGPAQPATRVEAVYPSSVEVPENLLKLYLHFSAPMSRGEVYHRVRLLDQAGQAVDLPFLELEQELWDPEGKRLTLLFDPGRVKRDLKPHREVGSPLVEGRSYTLVIDSGWPDAQSRKLAAEYRKTFRVAAPDREPPEPRRWLVRVPRAATSDPLEIEFGEPLDHALLERVLEVTTAQGELLDGRIELDRNETLWRFRPARPWASGNYRLRTEKILEDLAGNMIGRPFEVDAFERVQERIDREIESVPFTVR
jgi:hypothetical protein